MAKKKQILITFLLGAEFAVLLRALLKQYYRMTFVCALWIILTLGFFMLQQSYSRLNRIPASGAKARHKLLAAVVMLLCIAACSIPMDLSPYWNGETADHRNQYELITESFLNGRLSFDYEVDPALTALNNPYSYQERIDAGVEFYWDHAFYDNQYYMYFGVAPVFLIFMPYRLLTGSPMTTYHATQFFTALFICGIFALFALLCRLHLRKTPFGRYLALSASVSLLSVWYSAAAPALYCTAITAGLALMVWSLYNFLRAVHPDTSDRAQLLWGFFGSLLGALTFACRPPIALANLLALPLLIAYLRRQSRITPRLIARLCLAVLPYVLVGAALMAYNYARFDNPFEFGQSYQLTITDQTDLVETVSADSLLSRITANFFAPRSVSTFGGALTNFPLLLLGAGVFLPRVWKQLRSRNLLCFVLTLCALPVLITTADALWSPVLLERYRMDIYFLLGILCFIAVGAWECRSEGGRALLDAAIFTLSVFAVFTCVHFFLIPNDANWTKLYFPELVDILFNLMTFDLFA